MAEEWASEKGSRSLRALHEEHRTWWATLCAYQERSKGAIRQLEEVLVTGPEQDVRARAEQFQNRFIREQEVIDELQHIVKTHEDSLARRIEENPQVALEAPFQDHADLRDRMKTADKLHEELLDEFKKWMIETVGAKDTRP